MADATAGIGAATISIGQTVTAYSFLLPRLQDVRRAGPTDPDIRNDVLLGQIAAGALSLATGLLLTWMSGSPYPAYTALFIAAVIGGAYQVALNSAGSTANAQ
jgi:hypothetical protein